MKILFIAPQNPFPPIDGGKISIYYPVKYLAEKYEVYIMFPKIGEDFKKALNNFKSINVTAEPFGCDTQDKITTLIKRVFTKLPFKMFKYYNKNRR